MRTTPLYQPPSIKAAAAILRREDVKTMNRCETVGNVTCSGSRHHAEVVDGRGARHMHVGGHGQAIDEMFLAALQPAALQACLAARPSYSKPDTMPPCGVRFHHPSGTPANDSSTSTCRPSCAEPSVWAETRTDTAESPLQRSAQ